MPEFFFIHYLTEFCNILYEGCPCSLWSHDEWEVKKWGFPSSINCSSCKSTCHCQMHCLWLFLKCAC